MADALDSKSSVEIHAGSSPASGTLYKKSKVFLKNFYLKIFDF